MAVNTMLPKRFDVLVHNTRWSVVVDGGTCIFRNKNHAFKAELEKITIAYENHYPNWDFMINKKFDKYKEALCAKQETL